jgi:hypothetical protein
MPGFNELVDHLKTEVKNAPSVETDSTGAPGAPPTSGANSPNGSLTGGASDHTFTTDPQLIGFFTQLIQYPYDMLASGMGEEGKVYKLNETEKMINGFLATQVVVYYLPLINVGKISLWLLIGFNVAILVSKTMEWRELKKKALVKEPAALEKPAPENKKEIPNA